MFYCEHSKTFAQLPYRCCQPEYFRNGKCTCRQKGLFEIMCSRCGKKTGASEKIDARRIGEEVRQYVIDGTAHGRGTGYFWVRASPSRSRPTITYPERPCYD